MSINLEKQSTKKPPFLAILSKFIFTVFYSAESRTTSRTFAKKEEQYIEQLVEAAHSPEVTKLYEIFMDGYRNAGNFEDNRTGAKLIKHKFAISSQNYLDNTIHS